MAPDHDSEFLLRATVKKEVTLRDDSTVRKRLDEKGVMEGRQYRGVWLREGHFYKICSVPQEARDVAFEPLKYSPFDGSRSS